VFVEITLCIKPFWREEQIQAPRHLIAGFEHGKGKGTVALAQMVRCPLQLLIAHAKAVPINGFLHPKEQGEDAKNPIPIEPTVNTILSSSSLSLAIARHCTKHL